MDFQKNQIKNQSPEITAGKKGSNSAGADKAITKYNIGLDIGTSSVGWAVIDANTSEVLRFKSHNMIGSRLFESGETAKKRRTKRSVRRRYNRRRQRIELLRSLMAEDILKKDENFFRRLDEGFLYLEDKSVKEKYILFNDDDYTDKEFYHDDKYKTIYHLRNELCVSSEKKDIRMVYLALHNLIKYRGHFLYQGQKFSDINGSLGELLGSLYDELSQKCDCDCKYSEDVGAAAEKILMEINTSRKQKQEELVKALSGSFGDMKRLTEIVKLILGYAADFAVVFKAEELVDDSGKNLKLSFADSKYEEQEDSILETLQEKSVILETAKKIYSWYILQNILKGENTVAGAMVEKYNKHKEDLVKLKRIIKDNCSSREYTRFFRDEYDKDKKYLKNYTNYIAGEKRCNREEIYTSIKMLLENVEGGDKDYIFTEIEKETFLPLLNSKDNAAIPYQLTVNEAEKIIDNQGKYYPNLAANKEKILSIITFRIPYYVGPMNTGSKFSWIVRKPNERIYPWNFAQIVDEDQTAENFITRMTNKCTYLANEDVIPRYSLLYSRFVLLNELNKIRINGKLITHDDKERIISNLFMKYKVVKEEKFISYLKSINYQNTDSYDIQGYQKEKEFAASLASYIEFKKIFGEITPNNEEMIEQIIYWLTIFEEKEIVKRKINDKYGDIVSKEQLSKICKLRYTGWSRISKRLLTELCTEMPDCSKLSIMNVLENTNLNFMQVINDKSYSFGKLIEKENNSGTLTQICIDDITKLQGSPAIKKGIWQTVRVINEIVDIMGRDPENIFIEFAREEDKKERNKSRLNNLKKCYSVLMEETEDYNDIAEAAANLKNKKYTDKLDSERMLLYFLQNGKCMYSEEPLDIDSLHLYQVDHIIPQSFIPDDSIENKALVKTELNQYKSDKLLLSQETRRRRYNYWSKLYKCNLIGAKKYNNLMRESIGENERRGFINRQLVETRQISKYVAVLLNQRFVNSNVVTIRAELSHNFREKYKLYKSREINDFHHAHDAFLAAVIGSFLIKRFPGMKSELIYDEFTKYYKNGDKVSFLKEKWGYILSLFNGQFVTEDGEIIWQGNDSIGYVKKILNSGDCRVTKKLEEITGQFYDETVYRKDCGKRLIPRKKNLPVNKYGGYSGRALAYYVVVEYTKKKKVVKELIGIPLYVKAMETTCDGAIHQYIANELKTPDYKIIKERILKNQLVIEDSNELYLVSDIEVVNAKQFFFGEKYKELYVVAARALLDHVKEDEKPEVEPELCKVYEYVVSKAQKQYKLFSDVFIKIYDGLLFEELSYDDKVKCLREMFRLLRANSEQANMAKFNSAKKEGARKLVDRMGRKGNHSLDISNTVFVDQSVTGLYERRYKI